MTLLRLTLVTVPQRQSGWSWWWRACRPPDREKHTGSRYYAGTVPGSLVT